MSTLVKELFNTLSDGVVVIAPDARVRFANEAARRMKWLEAGQEVPWPAAKRSVDAVSKGYAKPPVRLKLEGDSDASDEIAAVLLPGFTANDFLLVMHDDSDAKAYRNVTGNLFEFLRTDLKETVEALGGAVGSVAAALTSRDESEVLRERMVTARKCSSELTQRLDKLVTLSEALSRDRLHADDRIPVATLVERAWAKVSPIAQASDTKLSLVGFTEDLSPVYGSQSWLVQALAELLENAVRHAGPKAQVELEVHQTSHFVIATVRNHGRSPVPMKKGRQFLPFVHAVTPKGKPPAARGSKGLGVGLALVQRILELHGGHLRVGDTKDESTEFVMELPTGAPTASPSSLELQQAERYARDMAALLARQRKAAAPAN